MQGVNVQKVALLLLTMFNSSDFEKCYVGDGLYPNEKNILYADGEVIKTNVSTTQKYEGLLTKIKNWFK